MFKDETEHILPLTTSVSNMNKNGEDQVEVFLILHNGMIIVI